MREEDVVTAEELLFFVGDGGGGEVVFGVLDYFMGLEKWRQNGIGGGKNKRDSLGRRQ